MPLKRTGYSGDTSEHGSPRLPKEKLRWKSEGEDCTESVTADSAREIKVKEEIVEKFGFSKVTKVTAGGKERYDSVYAGLCACENTDYVLIHDGARPFVTEEILGRVCLSVKETGACVVGMPVKDTIKISDRNEMVQSTPERERVWLVQTPQAFRYSLIKESYESILNKDMSGITDDAMIVEQESGVKVALVRGSYENIKITTPEDMIIAEAFLHHGLVENKRKEKK